MSCNSLLEKSKAREVMIRLNNRFCYSQRNTSLPSRGEYLKIVHIKF